MGRCGFMPNKWTFPESERVTPWVTSHEWQRRCDRSSWDPSPIWCYCWWFDDSLLNREAISVWLTHTVGKISSPWKSGFVRSWPWLDTILTSGKNYALGYCFIVSSLHKITGDVKDFFFFFLPFMLKVEDLLFCSEKITVFLWCAGYVGYKAGS